MAVLLICIQWKAWRYQDLQIIYWYSHMHSSLRVAEKKQERLLWLFSQLWNNELIVLIVNLYFSVMLGMFIVERVEAMPTDRLIHLTCKYSTARTDQYFITEAESLKYSHNLVFVLHISNKGMGLYKKYSRKYLHLKI